MNEVARITVNLPDETWRALQRRAKLDGRTKTEALRHAVWLYMYFIELAHAGNGIVVIGPDGTRERLIFPQ
jgi:hypothetical protein